MMDNLPDIPPVFPSLAFSRSFSIAEEPSPSLLLFHQFIHNMHDRLRFPADQIPIPDDRQLDDLSACESILILFMWSSPNALASIIKQLDTVTTQLAAVQFIVATLPTSTALDSRLSPINASLCDLSQRVSAAPPAPAAPSQPAIPPSGVVTHPAAPPPAPRPHAPPRRSATVIRASTRTSPDMIRSGAFSLETPAVMQTSSLTRGKPTRSVIPSTLIPRLSSRVILTPTVPNPSRHTLRPPRLSPPERVIRRRAPPLRHKWRPSATQGRRFRPPRRSPQRKQGSTFLALPHINTTKPP